MKKAAPKAWHEEPLSRRLSHAMTDARRRSNISHLHQSFVRLIKEKTGNSSLTTQQALQYALALLDQHSPSSNSQHSTSPPPYGPTPPPHSKHSPPPNAGEGGDGCWSIDGEDSDDPLQSFPHIHTTTPLSSISSLLATPSHIPRPLVFSNTHLRQLSILMGYAVQHYVTGAAFHPTLPNFRPTSALHSFLAGGGRCGVLSTAMSALDSSHDLSTTEPFTDFINRKVSSQCILRFTDAESEPPISYYDLARLLEPAVHSMNEEYVQGTVQTNPKCVLVAAQFPRAGQTTRTMKLMSLVRRANGREPVLIAVQFVGATAVMS